MDLTWKAVFKIVRQCLVERTLSLLAGHCLYIGLYGSDIGLGFWTRLWHYLDINAGPFGVWSGVRCITVEVFQPLTGVARDCVWGAVGCPEYVLVITLRFVIYLIENKHSYLSVCFRHVVYAFQSESTLYSCLNGKELLARNRREIWSLSLASLAKWLSVRLRTKWLSVRVQLQSLLFI